mmetsp:Transcript_10426/g.25929  ORF Transcript_10426/g.25929 Transcript_10426/m.25929 type:complete len:253 (+) Transcript_10426:741-1499(+)
MPLGKLVVQQRPEDGRAVATAVLLVQRIFQEDGDAVVLGEERAHLLLTLLGHVLLGTADEEHFNVESAHQVAAALYRCGEQRRVVPLAAPRATLILGQDERQVVLHHEQPLHQARVRPRDGGGRGAGRGRAPGRPGRRGAGRREDLHARAARRLCADAWGTRRRGGAGRHERVSRWPVRRVPVGDHVRLVGALQREVAIRPLLPLDGAIRAHDHELELHLALIEQQRVAPPDGVEAGVGDEPHAVQRIPTAE